MLRCFLCVVITEQGGDLGMVIGPVEYHSISPLVRQKNSDARCLC